MNDNIKDKGQRRLTRIAALRHAIKESQAKHSTSINTPTSSQEIKKKGEEKVLQSKSR